MFSSPQKRCIQTTPETAEIFAEKIQTTVVNGFTCMGMAFGLRLGLFDVMAKFTEPKTSQEIADEKGYKERYVREWLGIMVTSGIIDLDGEGCRYFLPRHRVAELTTRGRALFCTPLLNTFSQVTEELHNCFMADGPQGIPRSRYGTIYPWRTEAASQFAEWSHLERKLILIPDIIEQLEKGIDVCDMGTGSGAVPLTLAERFPKSTIWGLDIHQESMDMARRTATERGVKNTIYEAVNLSTMPEEWANKWDLVIMIDVAHHIPNQTKMLKDILRVLKPGGHYLMLDVGLHSQQRDNIDIPISPFIYTASLFHTLPESLNEEGGEGRGTAWGIEAAVQLIEEVGFVDVTLGQGLQVACKKPI